MTKIISFCIECLIRIHTCAFPGCIILPKEVTIKDIAKKLNIHHSTVSRALRDDPRVHAKTKKRILALAEKLDYQPNSIAKSLTTRSTKTIGILVPEIMHEFFGSVISGAEEVAYEEGYNIIVCQSGENYEREIVNARALISKQVDGLLVSVSQETTDGTHFLLAQKRGIPLVFFNRVCNGLTAARVLVDDYVGASAVMEHLISRGYRKIAHFAGPPAISVSKDRLNAYLDAHRKYGLMIDHDYIIYGGFSEDDGVMNVHKLLQLKHKMPGAIFAVNDYVAIGAITCLKENGFSIPGDIGIAGFSDDRVSSFIDPPLTTVRQPTKEMGRVALKLLLKQIAENKVNSDERTVLKTELIVRSSA